MWCVGVPITASVGGVTFEDAVDDLRNDYRTNRRRSLRTVEFKSAFRKYTLIGSRATAAD
jgi:hypothetical protein